MDLKVRVVAYKGQIIMVPDNPLEGLSNGKPCWVPSQEGKTFGCVLGDTKNRLGVSQEALDLMQEIKLNHDAVGDIGWWACDDGTHAFSWFGSIHRVINPKTSEGDRDFRVWSDKCTIIPNEIPEEAMKLIDGGEKIFSWREPEYIPMKKKTKALKGKKTTREHQKA